MKVQCDVCSGEEATVLCCADEAALCAACDARVHDANKLAGKHRRFSLLHPSSPQQYPLCDICQERRALLFCKEDRAILCRDCDAPIHDANDLTRNHTRFLLTGIKLSATPATSDAPLATNLSLPVSSCTSDDAEESPGDCNDVNRRGLRRVDADPKMQTKKPAAAAGFGSSKVIMAESKGVVGGGNANTNTVFDTGGGGGGSSISEYLMKELPGWRVEDLLLDTAPALHPAAATFAFSKTGRLPHMAPGEGMTPFPESDLDGVFPADCGGDLSGWWVPQVPQASPAPLPLPEYRDYGHRTLVGASTAMGAGDLAKLAARQQLQQQQHHHHRWTTSDDCFTVPEISTGRPRRQDEPPPPRYKRHRPASWCISP